MNKPASRVITIKTDAETKKAAQELAQDLGLTLSSLINSYLKQVVISRYVELYAPASESMTARLEGLLAKSERNIKAGHVSRPGNNVQDFLKDLKS